MNTPQGPAAFHYTTAAGIVKTGPGILNNILISAGAAAAVTLHNGTSGSDPVIMVIRCATNNTQTWSPPGGVAFSKGLYIAITSGTPDVTVTYL